MGYITNYGDANKVTYSGLTVKYSSERIRSKVTDTASGTDSWIYYYVYRRYATKRYSYVGMSYQAAKECQSAKLYQYTRTYAVLVNPNENENHEPSYRSVKQCMSDITLTHDQGGMWSVNISVNETDVKPSLDNAPNPATMFNTENGRNYDGETAGGGDNSITLDGVSRSGNLATPSYTHHIQNFNASSLGMMLTTSEVGEWSSCGSDGNGHFIVPIEGQLWCKLVYGSIESNTITTGG